MAAKTKKKSPPVPKSRADALKQKKMDQMSSRQCR
jgi:hypothetical protein